MSSIIFEYGDLLDKKADVMVNPANCTLSVGGWVCGKIFSASNAEELEDQCQLELKKRNLKRLNIGDLVVTEACGLKLCKKIFHIVSPNFNFYNSMQRSILFDDEGKELLYQCYINIFNEAVKLKLNSVRIPFLSSGNFCRDDSDLLEMATIAIDAARSFCSTKKERFNDHFCTI